jgi:hypothetical protein
MKSLLVSLTILAAVSSAAEIPAGTHVLLRMEHSVSTRTARKGDSVRLRTTIPVSVDGNIVVPVGTGVSGTIQRIQPHGRLHGRPNLEIGLHTLLLPTGASVDISPVIPVVVRSGFRSHGNRDRRPVVPVAAGLLAGFVGGGIAGTLSHSEETAAGVGLALGAATVVGTAILTRDRDVELSAGAMLDVAFDHAVKLD